ncbi:MAG: hypothetical protein DI563_23380, partial [Variovorax paradoxus]
MTQSLRRKNTVALIAALCGGSSLLMAPPAGAQESVLHGLGWVTQRPGTEVKGNSAARATGNKANAEVTAGGGKATAGAGLGASVDLIATAQANTVGLSALDVNNTQLNVLQNQVTGFVTAIGGAATANTALVSGGAGRRPLTDSVVNIQNNQAARIEAHGAKASVLLGAGSLQLPGRATANGLLSDETDVRRARIDVMNNTAEGIASLGGAA